MKRATLEPSAAAEHWMLVPEADQTARELEEVSIR